MSTHKGSDGSWPWDRIERYGSYKFTAENIAFGNSKGSEHIYSLYVNDGDKRKNIVDPKLALTGMAYCRHKIYGHILVINYASAFTTPSPNRSIPGMQMSTKVTRMAF